MSLASPYQEHYYIADGETTSFSFGEYFTAPASANVKCIVYFEDGTSSVPTFTVDIVTGYINITALTTPDGQVLNAPPAGSSVRVFRDTPEQQNVTASQVQNYTAKQLEKVFDSIVAMIQEVSYSDKHKTLRLTETQRDVFLAFLKEANDDALLYWDNEARTIVPTDFVRQDVVRMSGGLFFRMKHDAELRPYLEWSINGQTDWNSLNLWAPVDTANEAKETAEEAKQIAQGAKDVADDAKDVADEAKEIAEGIDGKAQQALDNSVEALETAEEAKEMIQNQIIVRSAVIPTAGADLVGKAYQYSGTTNGVYTHNYIYECQEIETNSYGWVRADIQPNHEAQILALQADVSDIEALIPAQATAQNQLGDKAFINSSIATNTANFIGTFNSVAELEAYSGTVTNNDYAFVIGTDSAGNTTYNRYKYNANTQQWIYEYTLNNSSFTADQWAAINSGVTASDVSKARSAVQPSDLGNGTITITQGGTTKGTFTTNQGNNTTIDIDVGGGADTIDAETHGSLTVLQNGNVSGTGTGNLIRIPGRISFDQNFEILLAFTTPQDYTAGEVSLFSADVDGWKPTGNRTITCKIHKSNNQYFLRFRTPGTTTSLDGTTPLNNETKYYVKIVRSGDDYTVYLSTNGTTFSSEITVTSNDSIVEIPYTISAFGLSSNNPTTIHLAECYIKLSNIIIWTGMSAPNLHQRAPAAHVVIAFQAPTAGNNYTWYRKYDDGWVEQGGRIGTNTTSITMPVEMSDSDYHCIVSFRKMSGNTNTVNFQNIATLTQTTTGFTVLNASTSYRNWQVSGMAAS